jgi:hypothetical protein
MPCGLLGNAQQLSGFLRCQHPSGRRLPLRSAQRRNATSTFHGCAQAAFVLQTTDHRFYRNAAGIWVIGRTQGVRTWTSIVQMPDQYLSDKTRSTVTGSYLGIIAEAQSWRPAHILLPFHNYGRNFKPSSTFAT